MKIYIIQVTTMIESSVVNHEVLSRRYFTKLDLAQWYHEGLTAGLRLSDSSKRLRVEWIEDSADDM